MSKETKVSNEKKGNGDLAIVSGSAAKGMTTELKARMILGGPEDDYKKGFNDAMQWAVRLVDRYKNGNGLFP